LNLLEWAQKQDFRLFCSHMADVWRDLKSLL